MLSAADLAGFDLAGLSSQLQSMVVRQDRYRREAESIGVSPECPETYRLVQAARDDAQALADLERLLFLVRRFADDEATGRPDTAPWMRIELIARARTFLARCTAQPCLPAIEPRRTA